MTPAADASRPQRLALVGLAVNFGLAAIKLVAGLVGHSYALVADAAESMTDIVGSAVIWGGLHIASRPADEEHPYGHGKAESLAAMVVAAMVVAAGVGIAIKAVGEIVTPSRPPAAFTLVVLIAVVVVKEVLFRVTRRAGAALGSSAAHTDAWHHRSDAITSLAAFIGISVALIGGPRFAVADGIAALVAAGVVVTNGVLLFRAPVHDLMDKAPAEAVARARAIAEAVPGVVNTEQPAARTSGTRIWIDLHIRVAPAMTVRDAHELAHRVKDAIRAEMPRVADVLVHVEPAGPPRAEPAPDSRT